MITGASGFIGSHLARLALQAGAEVAALALPDDPLTRLLELADRLTVLRADLSDEDALRTMIADLRADACVHLAWYAEPGKYLESPRNVPDLLNSLRLLGALIETGCPQVVMVGTCAEYDLRAGYVREDSAVRPETIYAACKLALGLVGAQMARASGVSFTWARLFYLYGPSEDERRLVPALIRSLLRGESFQATSGEQVRDYLHVEDVAQALWLLAERRRAEGFNVCSGEPVTIRQLLETVADLVGGRELVRFGEVPYRPWDPMFVCGDNRKLRGEGWSAGYTLRQGLEQTVDWWRWRLQAS